MDKIIESVISGKKAALIDMDGVLYDSMPYHAKAWRHTMLTLGIDREESEFFLYEGMTGPATINLLMQQEKGVTLSMEECRKIYAVKSDFFRHQSCVKPMPGADRMICALRRAGIRTVLVTGSAQSTLLDRLDHDYPGAFPKEMRVTALDVTNGKPHPEPYLQGLKKAGVSPDEAIVIENAPLGVRSGKAAGIFTVAVTTGPIPRSAFVTEQADAIFNSMTEFADVLEKRQLSGE